MSAFPRDARAVQWHDYGESSFPRADHVTSRGNERRPIFRDDRDRMTFLHFLRVLEWIGAPYG